MSLFERHIAIDWSGAAGERDRVDLRIAESSGLGPPRVVPPRAGGRAWRREECRAWLAEQLARSVNAKRGDSGGPFRFNESGNDRRFYSSSGVTYYRLIDALTPQAISPWYLESGSSVGYHTITGMFALDELIGPRSAGEVEFAVWPQEVWSIDDSRHVLVECFPALARRSGAPAEAPSRDPQERDALAVARWMADTDRRGNLLGFFALAELPFGRYRGVPFQRQVQFEGWILGVR